LDESACILHHSEKQNSSELSEDIHLHQW
jgi:hypothetical protein